MAKALRKYRSTSRAGKKRPLKKFVTVSLPGLSEFKVVIGCIPKGAKCTRATAKKNPALVVISNPLPKPKPKKNPCNLKSAKSAYKKFHMVDPKTQTKSEVPSGWPTTYITIGWATRFDVRSADGKKISKRYTTGKVKLCTTVAMKDVYIFGPGLGIPSGTALRVDYNVPAHSGRNKWANKWWHPHSSRPKVTADKGGRAVRIHGPGLKVNQRGIIG